MPCSTKIKIGSAILVQINAADEEDLFRQASFFGELPCKCGKCGSTSLSMRYRQTGPPNNYEYFSLTCNDCEAFFAIGQKREGGLYPRGAKETGEWEPKYEGGRGGGERTERGSYRQDDRRDDRRDTRPAPRRDDRRPEPQRGPRNQEFNEGPITEGMEEDDIPF